MTERHERETELPARGSFESPHKRTGQEIGESLTVRQPTVNHPLRTGQRKLLGTLYDDDSSDEPADAATDSR